MIKKKFSSTKTIDRAIDILECFLVDDMSTEFTLAELSVRAMLSPSTVYRITSTLENRNCLQRDATTKKYSLGSLFRRFKEVSSLSMKDKLKKVASPYMQALHEKYNESVGIMIRNGFYRTCIERIDSTNALRMSLSIGEKDDLDRGASGKVLMCGMDEEELNELLSQNTKGIKPILDQIRQNGYAVSIGERLPGVAAIAAPIYNSERKMVAALAMNGPQERIINEDLTEKIRATITVAEQITAAMNER